MGVMPTTIQLKGGKTLGSVLELPLVLRRLIGVLEFCSMRHIFFMRSCITKPSVVVCIWQQDLSYLSDAFHITYVVSTTTP